MWVVWALVRINHLRPAIPTPPLSVRGCLSPHVPTVNLEMVLILLTYRQRYPCSSLQISVVPVGRFRSFERKRNRLRVSSISIVRVTVLIESFQGGVADDYTATAAQDLESHLVKSLGKRASTIVAEDSAREVPTGPNPLHHNNNPARPRAL
ncbi:hypothetical protein GH714_039654 [Hevea brasiliensis]|uniref:Uncharacterized protein n=1 Tax=Hevea brasiliensis TaxID=3981 RepID=A0A6A6MZ31_HEVBR|nr:hypothetical protein GH714_039654 [Hevea brasiliensis]